VLGRTLCVRGEKTNGLAPRDEANCHDDRSLSCRIARSTARFVARSMPFQLSRSAEWSLQKAPLMIDSIRDTLRQHARLSIDVDALPDDADLYQAGMSSHATVNVMLALEQAFDIEFPDRMLRRSVFESIASMRAALEELRAA
jgi:acyl carrier protein